MDQVYQFVQNLNNKEMFHALVAVESKLKNVNANRNRNGFITPRFHSYRW